MNDRWALRQWAGRGVAFCEGDASSAGGVPLISTYNLARDGELGGIFAILAKQVREQAATCVDEPVTDLGK